MGEEFTWPRFATLALGVTAMIAGGFLMAVPASASAGAPLITAGGTLVGLAAPWPSKKRNGKSTPPPPP